MNQQVNTANAEPERALGLGDVFTILLRRKWIVIGTTLIVVGAAILASAQQSKLYEASADVLLQRQNLASGLTGTPDPNSDSNAGNRVALTQSRLASSPIVARRTLKALKLKQRSASDLLDNLTVTAEPDTDILSFTIKDGERDLAPALVNEYARQAIRYRSQLDAASVDRARIGIDSRLKRLRESNKDKGVLYKTLVAKQQQLSTLEALQTSNSYLVRRANDAAQIQPLPLRNALLGLIIGLVLGVGLAFAREGFDTRVRTAEGVAAAFHAPLLARIPIQRRGEHDSIAMLSAPGDRVSEAHRLLRNNLEYATRGRDVRSIMVTSAVSGEGKTTTVANLAAAAARAGRRVALVDLDLRHPQLQDFFNLQGRKGIINVAADQIALNEACYNVPLWTAADPTNRVALSRSDADAGSLTFVPAGGVPVDPGDFIGSARIASLLATLRATHDQVFVDAPPMLGLGDAIALAGSVDAVLLVGRVGLLQKAMGAEVQRMLSAVPVLVVGATATGVTARGARTYGQTPVEPTIAPAVAGGARKDDALAQPAADV